MTRLTSRWVRAGMGVLAAGALMVGATGCDEFFEIRTPNIINATDVDPVADGDMFSRSAFQNLVAAYGDHIIHSAWFNNEAWVGDTFPTRNEFGRRLVDDRNGTHAGAWNALVRAIASGEQVAEILGAEAGTQLPVARALFTSGYGMLLQGEFYCTGTFRQPGGEPGPEYTSDQLMEAAVERFDQVITLGGQASGAEATGLVGAARVSKGRALLNLGRRNEAAAAVSGVATSFVFNFPYVDDAGNRGRLGNGVYFYSAGGSRESLVVPDHYRAFNDPRITFADAGRDAQDGVLRFWSQRKYTNWAAPIPAANGLMARYIEVEARQDPAEMLLFVNERRAAGNQSPIASTNVTELMRELMAQSSRDFWLTGKRMGDWRRNGDLVPGIIPPGDNYYKPAVGTVSDQTCVPLPFGERNSNPNIN